LGTLEDWVRVWYPAGMIEPKAGDYVVAVPRRFGREIALMCEHCEENV